MRKPCLLAICSAHVLTKPTTRNTMNVFASFFMCDNWLAVLQEHSGEEWLVVEDMENKCLSSGFSRLS
jgi:hypothetical protein